MNHSSYKLNCTHLNYTIINLGTTNILYITNTAFISFSLLQDYYVSLGNKAMLSIEGMSIAQFKLGNIVTT